MELHQQQREKAEAAAVAAQGCTAAEGAARPQAESLSAHKQVDPPAASSSSSAQKAMQALAAAGVGPGTGKGEVQAPLPKEERSEPAEAKACLKPRLQAKSTALELD
jgi:hypothetical protein